MTATIFYSDTSNFFFFILELLYEVRCGSNEYFPPHMQKPQYLWKSSNLGKNLYSSYAFSAKFIEIHMQPILWIT